MNKLSEIKRSIRTLTPRELTKLANWLRELIDSKKSKEQDCATTKRRVLQERTTSNRTYRLEGVRCGKKNCKCATGQLHGPYWYAYWSEGGKTRSQYVGKTLPKKQKKARSERVR